MIICPPLKNKIVLELQAWNAPWIVLILNLSFMRAVFFVIFWYLESMSPWFSLFLGQVNPKSNCQKRIFQKLLFLPRHSMFQIDLMTVYTIQGILKKFGLFKALMQEAWRAQGLMSMNCSTNQYRDWNYSKV